ncbi:uncharacterized protein LOC125951877 [Anopheles darlingi]|uniref:uncharacterized protein LOC125951877 n=1 Tax=Anopheles darlingi TaxID=43151 RepID=UPI00210062AB|nr:uncharacterized protein LOC125951877 [Anopheles darlingi]XP_049536953.1 uncharacterized protein LOC125951877 [Anopheles darlingi]
MKSLRCLIHQCNSVALATIVFLLMAMIDVQEQTMLTEHPPLTTEDVPDSKQIISNSRIQSSTMSPPLSSPSSVVSIPASSAQTPEASSSSSSSSSLSATGLSVPTLQMVTLSFPSPLPVSAESLVQGVTAAGTDVPSTSPRLQQGESFGIAEALAQGTVTTTDALTSGTGLLPTEHNTTAGFRSESTVFQYEDSSAHTRHTTFRPLLIPTLPEVRRSRIVHSMPYQSKHHHERHWGPFFEEPVNVTSGAALQVGYHLSTEAILNCRVGMLKDKTVMWIRRTTDKVSLLTVGNNTYSGDPRIKVKFQYPNNWRLHIKPIKSDDAGLYMCQVSTHPPRVFATNLTVLEPAVRIVDEMGYEFYDRYYKLGSTIDISCQVSMAYLASLPAATPTTPSHQLQRPKAVAAVPPPANVLSGDELSKYDSRHSKESNKWSDTTDSGLISWSKDGAELPKDIKLSFSGTKQWLISRISILQANRVHNGVYNCTVAGKQSSSAQVQVLNGETPAAVQHNAGRRCEVIVPLEIQATIVLVLLASWSVLLDSNRIQLYGFLNV